MTMRWFGRDLGTMMHRECPQVVTPDAVCVLCDERIVEGDDGFIDAGGTPTHRECFLRMIYGSVAHQAGICSCHGYNDTAETGFTKRHSAQQAVEFYNSQHSGAV